MYFFCNKGDEGSVGATFLYLFSLHKNFSSSKRNFCYCIELSWSLEDKDHAQLFWVSLLF